MEGVWHTMMPVIDWSARFSQWKRYLRVWKLWWSRKCRYFLFFSPNRKCQHFPCLKLIGICRFYRKGVSQDEEQNVETAWINQWQAGKCWQGRDDIQRNPFCSVGKFLSHSIPYHIIILFYHSIHVHLSMCLFCTAYIFSSHYTFYISQHTFKILIQHTFYLSQHTIFFTAYNSLSHVNLSQHTFYLSEYTFFFTTPSDSNRPR